MDCEGGDVCKDNHCVPAPGTCASTKDCGDPDLVCDKEAGLCVECVTDADCGALESCADAACAAQICTPGQWACTPSGAAALCDDTGLELSVPVDCLGGTCFDSVCLVGPGCVETPVAGPCEDGDVCTVGDACSGGTCVSGAPDDCDDGDACTLDTCVTGAGCSHVIQEAACDDGDVCTTFDTCVFGDCVGGPPLDCDDGNPCTDDACDPVLGCQAVANDAACDDGDACSTDDVCADAACVGGPPPDCDDGNPCTDDPCDPALGCQAVANDAACDDGDACSADDVCADAACVSGPPLDCDDGDACSVDGCDPASGCTYGASAAPGCCAEASECDDGDPCTTASCDGFTCVFPPDPAAPDLDGDGVCDEGDPDDDGDGVPDEADAAPANSQVCSDVDADGCDDCTSGTFDPAEDGPDGDGDGLCDAGDVCPDTADPEQEDSDGDGWGNACDNCPIDANPDQADVCSDDDDAAMQLLWLLVQ
jgi:hypothetical protein